MSLSWTDKANNEEGFIIERKAGTAAFQVLTTLPANRTNYTDATTASKTTYSYRVRAFNASGSSQTSNEISVKSK
jgi:hypothetical protein